MIIVAGEVLIYNGSVLLLMILRFDRTPTYDWRNDSYLAPILKDWPSRGWYNVRTIAEAGTIIQELPVFKKALGIATEVW